jgi:histidinol phosphatase-like PHP family hydrolase
VDLRIEFPDIPGYRTLKCDFHIHTVFSDGRVWPTIRVEEGIREGLDAIALTDHLEYKPHLADIAGPDQNRSHEIAQAAVKGP